MEIADDLEKENIRVDIDDRQESVGKKVRYSEMEWIPMTIVVGQNEKDSGKLPVRFRKNAEVKKMYPKELIEAVNTETKGFPYKPLPLNRMLTKRPKFVG